MIAFSFLLILFSIFFLAVAIQRLHQRLVKIQRKQIELETNYDLLSRRVDNIFKNEIFVTENQLSEIFDIFHKNFEKNLKKTTENTAFEVEEIRKNFEKITKSQAKRLGIVERKMGIAPSFQITKNKNIF